MDSNAKFAKMVVYSVECMGRMAVDQVSVEEICQSGCVTSALTACTTTKSNVVQTALNTSLLRACRDDTCVTEVSKAINGDFSSFAYSLENHLDRDSVLSNAQILSKLARAPPPEGPRNVAEMKRLGIFDSLAKRAMECPEDDLDLLAALADVLAVGADDPVIAQMLLDTGVMQKLLRVLAANPSHKALARSVADLVGNAASAGDHIVAQLRELDCLGAFAGVLRAHPGDRDLTAVVSRALAMLSDANQVQQVVAQLSAPGQTWSELAQSSSHLAALTLVPSHLPYFKSGAGVDTLVALVNRGVVSGELHAPAVGDAVTQSLLGLSRVCAGGEHHVYAVMRCGGVAAITGALNALIKGPVQPGGEAIVAAGVEALRAMLTRAENAKYVDSHGAFVAALSAAGVYIKHPHVATALAEMVISALNYPEHLSGPTRNAMIDSMLAVLAAHPDNARIVALALDALNRLAGSEEEERRIIAGGIVDMALQALRDHPDDREVVKHALIALELALQIPDSLTSEQEALLKRLLENIRRKYANTDDDELMELLDGVGQGLQAFRDRPLASPIAVAPLPPRTHSTAQGVGNLGGMSGMDANQQAQELLAQLRKLGVAPAVTGESSPIDDTRMSTNSANSWGSDDEVPGPPQMALHIMEAFNRVQQFLAERRAVKLLNMLEVYSSQPRSYDRDYLINAVLDALSCVAEEAAEAEFIFAHNTGVVDSETSQLLLPDNSGVSVSLKELEAGIIIHAMGERVCDHILRQDSDDDIAVLSDSLATLLSLIDRDSCRMVLARGGLQAQAESCVGTDDVPYVSSNPTLDLGERFEAVENMREALAEARIALEEAERDRVAALKVQRALEVERLRALTQNKLQVDNEAVLARIAEAKAAAEEKSRKLREEMAERLAKAKEEQNRKLAAIAEDAERRRQEQIEELREAARAATLAKVELEKRMAETGTGSKYQTKATLEDVAAMLDASTKQFLTVGGLVTKHSGIHSTSRHLYLTPNCEYLIWRHAGASDVKPSQMMKITKFQAVKSGRCTSTLKSVKSHQITEDSGSVTLPGTQVGASAGNDSAVGGSPFFAIFGIDTGGKDKDVSFEAPTVDMARKWVAALNQLASFAQHLKQFHGVDTLTMNANPLHNIIAAEKKLAQFDDDIDAVTPKAQTQTQAQAHLASEDDIPPPPPPCVGGGFVEDADDF
jgi:hypothetical protein